MVGEFLNAKLLFELVGSVAQSGRVLAFYLLEYKEIARCRGFKSRRGHHTILANLRNFLHKCTKKCTKLYTRQYIRRLNDA